MIEPTREQDRTAEMICEMRGGWAAVDPPLDFGRGDQVVTVAGGDTYIVWPDGRYIDPDNRLHEPEEE